MAEAHKGMRRWPSSAFFVLGANALYAFAFAGSFYNLVVYLRREWQQSSAKAATNVSNVVGTMYLAAVGGAFLADAYLGNLHVASISAAVYTLGSIITIVGVSLYQEAILFVGLYTAAVGCGSYGPLLTSLGGDQMEGAAEKASFINWASVAFNGGQVLALTGLTYLQDQRDAWVAAAWATAGAVGLSALLVVAGAGPRCRRLPVSGNPLVRVAQVLTCAARNRHVRLPASPRHNDDDDDRAADYSSCLFEVGFGKPSAILGCRKLKHTDQLRFLDKAAIVTNDERLDSWHVCTITQVEEVKCLIRTMPIFFVGVAFFIINAQITLFVEQGDTMDGTISIMGLVSFTIPTGSMQLFTTMSIILFIAIYDNLCVPWLRKRTGYEKGLTTLQRMGLGIVISIFAMVVAAIVERKRLEVVSNYSLYDYPNIVVPMSIYWLVPQYVLVGICLVFTSVGLVDFFYSELSDGMRSLGVAIPSICGGLGNYCSAFLISIVTQITSQGSSQGWFPSNLNRAHLDYFYYLVATIMSVTLLFYLLYAQHYTYLSVVADDIVNDSNDGSYSALLQDT